MRSNQFQGSEGVHVAEGLCFHPAHHNATGTSTPGFLSPSARAASRPDPQKQLPLWPRHSWPFFSKPASRQRRLHPLIISGSEQLAVSVSEQFSDQAMRELSALVCGIHGDVAELRCFRQELVNALLGDTRTISGSRTLYRSDTDDLIPSFRQHQSYCATELRYGHIDRTAGPDDRDTFFQIGVVQTAVRKLNLVRRFRHPVPPG